MLKIKYNYWVIATDNNVPSAIVIIVQVRVITIVKNLQRGDGVMVYINGVGLLVKTLSLEINYELIMVDLKTPNKTFPLKETWKFEHSFLLQFVQKIKLEKLSFSN